MLLNNVRPEAIIQTPGRDRPSSALIGSTRLPAIIHDILALQSCKRLTEIISAAGTAIDRDDRSDELIVAQIVVVKVIKAGAMIHVLCDIHRSVFLGYDPLRVFRREVRGRWRH